MLPEETRMQAMRLAKQYPYPGASIDGIMQLLDAGYRMEFQHSQPICTEGEPAACMYVLTYGKVSVIKRDFSGQTRRVTTLHSPSLFGHMSMVDGSPRSATCVSEGIATVVVIDRDNYQRLVSENTAVGRTLRRMLLSSMADQLSRGNQRLRELTGGAGAGTQPRTDVTQDELTDISSELEGWRSAPQDDDASTEGYTIKDTDGPIGD